VLRHIDFATAKVVVVASPGFVKEDFKKFLFEEAARKGDKVRSANHSTFSCSHGCLDPPCVRVHFLLR
jgi:protein pelota